MMSFSPLPETFRTDLDRRTDLPALELGCGDGRFTRLLREAGLPVVGMDRRPPLLGARPDLVGDAVAPPLRAASLGLLIVPNLLRQCWPPPAGLLGRWRECLRPEGVLWILEDEPGETTPAQRNYRDLQAWLASTLRRPLLPLREFRASLGAEVRAWRFGRETNRYPVADLDVVLDLLRGSGDTGPTQGEAARLSVRIAEDGLAYGNYWWARHAPGEAAS